MVVTEEDYQRPTCAGAGSLQTWRIGADNVIRNLDSWEVEIDPARTTLCSAHYFDEAGGLLAQGWYEQGTRFLDVTRPEKIRQVGFWIPEKNVTWGAVYAPTDPSRSTVYSLDSPRGIDVLRIDRSKRAPRSRRRSTSRASAPDVGGARPPTGKGPARAKCPRGRRPSEARAPQRARVRRAPPRSARASVCATGSGAQPQQHGGAQRAAEGAAAEGAGASARRQAQARVAHGDLQAAADRRGQGPPGARADPRAAPAPAP